MAAWGSWGDSVVVGVRRGEPCARYPSPSWYISGESAASLNQMAAYYGLFWVTCVVASQLLRGKTKEVVGKCLFAWLRVSKDILICAKRLAK